MAKILDVVDNMFFIKITYSEYNKMNEFWFFEDNDEKNFDEAVKNQVVRDKLSLLSTKL